MNSRQLNRRRQRLTAAMSATHGEHVHGIASSASGDGAADTLEYAPLYKLLVTGLAFGAVHVLTGPGHFGALVALANGQSWWTSFALGVQWGCGHSIGILVVAAACVALGHALAVDGILQAILNYVMGIVLIFIGAWTLYHASVDYESASRPQSKWGNVHCEDASYTLLTGDEGDNQANLKELLMNHSPSNVRRVQRATSVGVGVLHGFAGPGAVLVVAPVVLMHGSILRPVAYLGCFCLSSIICMGAFAAAYGELTRRSSLQSIVVAFRIACMSSAITILIGLIWVVLQACGGLDDVFGHHH